MTDRSQHEFSRRRFLQVSAAGACAGALLSACGPAAPSAAPTGARPGSTGGAAAGKGAGPYPTFVPFTSGATPDYHTNDPRYDDGYDNFPEKPFKAVAETPGSGGGVTVLNRAYFPAPTPYEQNPTWQEINHQLNANVQINIVPGAGAEYRTKFATVMASDDLPDIMHIYNGYQLAANLPAFFKAKCADLTPYLAGDAAKDYPYLAAIPTYAWKNSISAIDGSLYLVPIQRHLPTFPTFGGYFFANTDVWDKEIGQGYVPHNADDFKRILQQLTRPQEGRYGIGNAPGGGTAQESGPFGLATHAAMFGAPNQWRLDGGKLLRNRETEEYKAAVGFVRDLMAAGVYPPDVATLQMSRPDHAAGKFVVAADGYGNSWIDLWRRGLTATPPRHFHMLKPFPAVDGGKPQAFLSHGFISMNALKKASPDRIKELLRILNYLAAPFGSQEDLLLSYGIQGQDYTLDDRGNPVPTSEGINRSGYVPWRYIAQHPYVNYQADLPGFARASYEAQQVLMPMGVEDPTDGFYSATAVGKGVTADVTFYDGLIDVILGRRPFGDYDSLLRDWQRDAGDQMRKEYLDAMAATKA